MVEERVLGIENVEFVTKSVLEHILKNVGQKAVELDEALEERVALLSESTE